MLNNLINPEVLAPMVSANLPKKIKFSSLAQIDNTLKGRAGNTITVPKYAYIGDAEVVAEGVAMGTTVLTASSVQATVKKAGKAVEITDEAVLSGYGDPVGETANQLSMSIASKIDDDCLTALKGASLKYDGSAGKISYEGVVNAIDVLKIEEDGALNMAMFVAPAQLTQLRLDPDFKDINKYPLQTMMTGVVGSVAGVQIVVSKRITKNGDGNYENPIVVRDVRDPNQADDADGYAESQPALTIYMKREIQLETDRDILKKTSVVSADEHYTVVLSNDSKALLATFKG